MKVRGVVLAMALSLVMGMQSFAATEIGLNLNWKYAGNSKINTGKAVLYTSDVKEPKHITIAVNAGHGTKGGGEAENPLPSGRYQKVNRRNQCGRRDYGFGSVLRYDLPGRHQRSYRNIADGSYFREKASGRGI